MRSTLTFWACLEDEPSEADALTIQITQAIIACITGQEVCGGIQSTPSSRKMFFPVHVDRIPQEWLQKAEQLVKQGYITRYEWSGDVEQIREEGASVTVELVHDGKAYKGVLYRVAQEEGN